MKLASKFLWVKWYCSFPIDESTEALWLFTSTHLYIWQLYHWNISSSETNIKGNTFPFILVQWIVNSCCFNCSLGIFCKKRRNFMVWSPVPAYCFIRGLWQWLVHKWRCLNFSCSFTLLLTVKLMCPCRPLDKHAVAVNALHFWGSHCLRHVVLGRNVVFPGETQGDGEEPVCLLCQPLKCSGQWNPSHKVLLGTGPSLPASICIYPPFSWSMVLALWLTGLMFHKNCQHHVPLWGFTHTESWAVKASTSLSSPMGLAP